MFGLQLNEVIVTLIIALIIFGPQRLPEIARGLGKAIREFRETSSQVTEEFRRATDLNAPPDPVPGTQPRVAPAPVSEASILAPAAAVATVEDATAPISEASMRTDTTEAPIAPAFPTADVTIPETTALVGDTPGLTDTTSVSVVEPGEATSLMSDAPQVAETLAVGTVEPGEATSLMSDAPGLADTAPTGTAEPMEAAAFIPSSEVSEPVIPPAPLTSTSPDAGKAVTDTDHDKSPPAP